jgi:hypothetical protein
LDTDFVRSEAKLVKQNTPQADATAGSDEDEQLPPQLTPVPSDSSASYTFSPPTIDSSAMFGPIIVTISPFSQYVPPPLHYHIREQQHIINWHHINNFLFDDDGARYVRQISCHNTSDRPLLDGYNAVFLYNSVVLFTPASPFDILLQLTHVWYTVTNSQNSIFYFDLVPQHCTMEFPSIDWPEKYNVLT